MISGVKTSYLINLQSNNKAGREYPCPPQFCDYDSNIFVFYIENTIPTTAERAMKIIG